MNYIHTYDQLITEKNLTNLDKLTCVLMGIFPTPNQTSALTTASWGTTVLGIRHFSTRTHRVVPAMRHLQKLSLAKYKC